MCTRQVHTGELMHSSQKTGAMKGISSAKQTLIGSATLCVGIFTLVGCY